MEKVARKDEEKCKAERLRFLLTWLASEKSAVDAASTQFVCFRGCLSTLMASPYERRESWTISAVKYQSTIFIHKEETREQRERRLNASERDKRMSSWGYKFEEYLSRPLHEGEEDPKKSLADIRHDPVMESEEFCCVYRTKLGSKSIIFGAEMDAVEKDVSSDGDLNHATFIELKTSRQIDHAGQHRNFCRFKLLKWWCQCFLVAIPKVICGFRDDDGLVHTLREFPVAELPKQGASFWRPNACMAFLDDLLDHVGRVMARQDGGCPGIGFEWRPENGQVRHWTLNPSEVEDILPEGFRREIFS